MTQLTIRGLDEQLHQRLKEEAQRRGLSMNRYVLFILEKTAGLNNGQELPRREFHDLDRLAGTWSQADYEAFKQELAQQRSIDEDLWS